MRFERLHYQATIYKYDLTGARDVAGLASAGRLLRDLAS